jgi:hypothetical protein
MKIKSDKTFSKNIVKPVQAEMQRRWQLWLAGEVKKILEKQYGKVVSLRRIKDMLEGNPMVDQDTTSDDAAHLISSHLEDCNG